MLSPVQKMFDEISERYDFLNHTLSCFRDIAWRRACCRELKKYNPGSNLLDLCGGTGDFAKTYRKFFKNIQLAILGDFSYGMLKYSQKKNVEAIPLQLDAMKMPFAAPMFDVILNGFGMRNLPDAKTGLEESSRVLVSGGYLVILEFFSPRNRFNAFFYKKLAPLFIPFLGAFFSKKRSAYEYLLDSIRRFLSVEDFLKLAENSGFDVVSCKACDFGIAYRIILQKKECI